MSNYEKQLEYHRNWSREYYKKNRERTLNRIENNRRKRTQRIREALGNRCVICGATTNLIIHHLAYSSARCPTLRDLKNGLLSLVCRKHHRAIQFVNTLRRKGELDRILELLNKDLYLNSRTILHKQLKSGQTIENHGISRLCHTLS